MLHDHVKLAFRCAWRFTVISHLFSIPVLVPYLDFLNSLLDGPILFRRLALSMSTGKANSGWIQSFGGRFVLQEGHVCLATKSSSVERDLVPAG